MKTGAAISLSKRWRRIRPERLLPSEAVPRNAARAAFTALLLILLRLPFVAAGPIPYAGDFNPAVALVPLAGILWGPAGALGAAVGRLGADRIAGIMAGLSLFRAAGDFLFALLTQIIWQAVRGPQRPSSESAHIRVGIVATACAIPGVFTAALWGGVGAVFLRLYSFAYYSVVTAVHDLLFVIVFTPAAYHFAAMRPTLWSAAAPVQKPDRRSFPGGVRLAALALYPGAAWLILLYVERWLYSTRPWPPCILGTAGGPLVRWMGILALGLQLLLLRRMRTTSGGAVPAGSFQHLSREPG